MTMTANVSLTLDNVKRADSAISEDFLHDHVRTHTPLVISDTQCGTRIAGMTTEQGVIDAFGGLGIQVQQNYTSRLSRTTEAVRRQGLSQKVRNDLVEMPLRDYLDHVRENPDTDLLCVEYRTPDAVLEAMRVPDVCQVPGSGEPLVTFTFIANQGNYAHLHFDGDFRHVLLYQVFGRKRVVMVPLSAQEKILSSMNFSKLVIQNMGEEEKLNLFRYLGAYDCVISPGEAVYFPPSVWHYVECIDTGMSVNFRLGREQFAARLVDANRVPFYPDLHLLLARLSQVTDDQTRKRLQDEIWREASAVLTREYADNRERHAAVQQLYRSLLDHVRRPAARRAGGSRLPHRGIDGRRALRRAVHTLARRADARRSAVSVVIRENGRTMFESVEVLESHVRGWLDNQRIYSQHYPCELKDPRRRNRRRSQNGLAPDLIPQAGLRAQDHDSRSTSQVQGGALSLAHESVNFYSLMRIPILFVTEQRHDQYNTTLCTPSQLRSSRSRYQGLENTVSGILRGTADPESDVWFTWNNMRVEEEVGPVPAAGIFFDETLRDGLQAPYVGTPNLEQKLRIIDHMAQCGIRSADLGFPGSGPVAAAECTRIARYTAEQGYPLAPGYAGRMHPSDINAICDIAQTVGVAVDAYVFIGVSPIRQYVEDWNIEFIVDAVRKSAEDCAREDVGFVLVLEDAVRCTPEMLGCVFDVAFEVGVERVTLCDTVGAASPEGTASLLLWSKRYFAERGHHVDFEWHGHNDRGLALINSLTALGMGCSRVHGTILGIGERAGNASLDQLMLNSHLDGQAVFDLKALREYCEYTSAVLEVPIPSNYPGMGRDVFKTSAGVHAAAILKAHKKGNVLMKDTVYSSVPASVLGREQEVLIDAASGASNVRYWLTVHGYETADPDVIKDVLDRAKSSNRPLTDELIRQIIASAK
ncbi:MAG: cupin-like domain-containing protein [Pseudonocardiales bacterium]|nr:cupin-like domain-containing protein [Pseudonocardiales bacterium]